MGCDKCEAPRKNSGGPEESLLSKLAWLATLLASLAVLIHGVGWLALFLSTAADGSTEVWTEFVHATPGLVMAYALIVLFPPLAIQPFFALIVFATLVAARLLGRVSSRILACVWSPLPAPVHQALRDLSRLLETPVGHLRIHLLSKPEVMNRLRVLIGVFEHEGRERPYIPVLKFVIVPTIVAVLSATICLSFFAVAYPGALWITSLMSLTAMSVGYVGSFVFVATLSTLAIPLSGGGLVPRVTSWKGVLLSVGVLYVFLALSGFLSIIA